MNNPRQKFVEVARRYAGIREFSPNRFDHDDEIWSSTSYPDGGKNREPYCAAFVCHVVATADSESADLEFYNRPKCAAVRDWKDWARKPMNGVEIIEPGTKDPQPGDIVNFLPHISHIGIVTGFDAARNIVHTIEANTNDAGGREGDGIYEKERRMSICGEFYRLPARARHA